MRKLAKYSLVLQVAVAGVALAQVQSNPAVQGNTGAGTPAGQTGRVDQNSNMGTIDDRSGVQDTNIRRDKVAPAGTMRASKLIGAEVYNQQNKHLGEIKDIVLDKNDRKVGYVVLSYGGIAGLGDKLFALPRNMVQIAPETSPTGQTKAMVALDEQTLKSAPGFDKDHWPTEANADYYRNLDQYYQQHGGATPAAAQMGSEGNLTWNHRVSELIGANVKSPQGESLGEIHDLVLDWPGGQVRYAVLSYGGLLGLGDKLFAVPIEQFQSRDKDLVLSIDKEQLKNAPGFDKNHWPDVANPTWSRSVDQYYQQHGMQGHTGEMTR